MVEATNVPNNNSDASRPLEWTLLTKANIRENVRLANAAINAVWDTFFGWILSLAPMEAKPLVFAFF